MSVHHRLHRLLAAAWLPLLLAGAPAAPAAGPVESLDRIRTTVARHLEQRLGPDTEVAVGRLDPRLRLSRCTVPLQAFDTPANGRHPTTVGVRCSGVRPWQVFVPVRVVARTAVVVAARPLARGTLLTAADLRVERRDVNSLARGYLVDPARAVGQRLTRPLASGAVLTPAMLRRPLVLRRGQQVVIASRIGAISVRSRGEALRDAAAGQRVSVRSATTGRVVEGIARPGGVVEVTL